ncbi:heme ABC exporter, ATP-binding protein CcmA [Desulfosporosinus orientis DSM 765]|uniref:Heme ABC exporter, ATP-binding protein CcmA n=1 Tax=Desulfosporosinus orientis (strain ATCC 19365 / DSM 765 / NCIMB 8382 / VKM B-1628 / Singapore I) TaxID=768706 RepID=G7WCC6_DESOD|nr:heme ABC exporter ATP-binding protein CcmA [Desulfosporosinus orientis]AET66248.1 heme ABC exporter, ATP-binding protein CcmA [Desulfosporosinus orientis DSM 765]
MIVTRGLTKKIGNKQILKGIDLEIASGEFVTCFGPNGAGKSTTLKILAMLTKPSGGQVLIDGQDVRENGSTLRRKIGLISHHSFLYENLTAWENLEFYGRMYEVPNLKKRITQLLNEVGLSFAADDPVHSFSRGMQQRLSIARALVHNPPILLMDEPYTGLDEIAKGVLKQILSQLAQSSHTVFLITHDFDQGLEQSDQALILAGGRIIYTCNPRRLQREEFRQRYLEVVGGV